MLTNNLSFVISHLPLIFQVSFIIFGAFKWQMENDKLMKNVKWPMANSSFGIISLLHLITELKF